MGAGISEVERAVDRFGAGLEPDLLTTAAAAALLRDAERVSRKLDAAMLRLSRRAAEAEEWKRQGFPSYEAWLAHVTGTGLGAAHRMSRTARQLDDLDATAEALAAGEISAEQAGEIALGASADPAQEERLIKTAKREGLRGVQRESERVRATALDDEELARRARRNRHLRKVRGGAGEFTFIGSTDNIEGAEFWTRVRTEADQVFRQARRGGERDEPEAYMLDALMNLVLGRAVTRARTPEPGGAGYDVTADEGTAPASRAAGDPGADAATSPAAHPAPSPAARPAPSRPHRAAFVRVDLEVLNRGCTRPGDTCEVAGAGPIPAAGAKAWLADADVWMLFHRADEVQRVVHLGRQVTEAQRVALYERANFTCENEGCTVTNGLEIDHVTGWSVTKKTTLDDLALLCHADHHKKTYLGWSLVGPPGRRRLVPPPERGSEAGEAGGADADVGAARRGMERARRVLREVVDSLQPRQPGFDLG